MFRNKKLAQRQYAQTRSSYRPHFEALEDRFLPSVSFLPTANVPSGGVVARNLVSGDFDRDGDLDLAVVNRDSNDVTVLLNDGHGSFAMAGTVPVGIDPLNLAAGDLDGDGDLDLVVTRFATNDVLVLVNAGNGSFAPGGAFPAGQGPIGLVAQDLDGDGDLDLAVANETKGDTSGRVSILLNNGSGWFTPAGEFLVGAGPQGITAGDFNGDGLADLATADTGANTASILFNQGAGSFAVAATYAVGTEPISTAAGDVDGDGDIDLVVANVVTGDIVSNVPGDVSVLRNRGDGTFDAAVPVAAGDGPVSVKLADLDHDGDLDIAVANLRDNTVSVALNDGHGSFGTATNFAVGNVPNSLATGDLNGDGLLDLATTNGDSSNVSILLQAPGSSVQIDIKPGSAINSVNLASNGMISVAIIGSATFNVSQVDFTSVVFARAHAAQSNIADVNNDGIRDLVLTFRARETNLRTVYENLLAVADTNTNGALDASVSTHQTATLLLTGDTVAGQMFYGLDTADLFLTGKFLKDFLSQLVAAGEI